jgi:hypothetical protein
MVGHQWWMCGGRKLTLTARRSVTWNARVFVAFRDDTRYERLLVPWDLCADWPKIAREISQFNAAACLA